MLKGKSVQWNNSHLRDPNLWGWIKGGSVLHFFWVHYDTVNGLGWTECGRKAEYQRADPLEVAHADTPRCPITRCKQCLTNIESYVQ